MSKATKRYTPADRARVLAAAAREGLSGPKAAKKFGISTLTYYTWRKKANTAGSILKTTDGSLAGLVRSGVRAKVAAIVPGIVRQEVAMYLDRTFGPKRHR